MWLWTKSVITLANKISKQQMKSRTINGAIPENFSGIELLVPHNKWFTDAMIWLKTLATSNLLKRLEDGEIKILAKDSLLQFPLSIITKRLWWVSIDRAWDLEELYKQFEIAAMKFLHNKSYIFIMAPEWSRANAIRRKWAFELAEVLLHNGKEIPIIMQLVDYEKQHIEITEPHIYTNKEDSIQRIKDQFKKYMNYEPNLEDIERDFKESKGYKYLVDRVRSDLQK